MIETKTWWKAIVLFAIGILLLNTFGATLGRIEGRFFPVTRDTVLTDIVDDDRISTFYGKTTKIRSCDFLYIEWFVGKHDGDMKSKLDFRIMERGKLRPAAPFEFGPWSVNISADDLRDNSFAEAHHKCHGLFPTITRFYP